ncbi:DinB family protein [Antarcticibacterium sp. 1MA-6-2]|uniref:DinB family protein n=1 Tax=Antarcticibacterium sp. 1MA-6-2 TaxID=2908210 RepID=UPI001F2F3113|nr:DinB family protein [Antarcticibacterium sp. 1MA-6-2]UJH91583.1 DinB family protein [Antarcticibacterium sp. 1MA-6-2]
MKNFVLILAVFLFFSSYTGVTQTVQTLKTEESYNDKAALLKYYEETAKELENKIKGLSEVQLKFKPSEESWSISQCLEHIIATEKMLFGMTKELLEKPENAERRSEITVTDEQLVSGMTDRSTKYKASAEIQPEGTYTSPQEALKDFKEQREEIQSFIKNSKANMRNYISDSPAGAVDGHQSLLFIAGHTARHTKQIEEIISQPAFPN